MLTPLCMVPYMVLYTVHIFCFICFFRDRNRNEDGWNHVGGGSGKSQRIEPGKLKLSRQTNMASFGPAKGFGQGSSWVRGSTGSGKNTPPQQEERPSTPTNKFAVSILWEKE